MQAIIDKVVQWGLGLAGVAIIALLARLKLQANQIAKLKAESLNNKFDSQLAPLDKQLADIDATVAKAKADYEASITNLGDGN